MPALNSLPLNHFSCPNCQTKLIRTKKGDYKCSNCDAIVGCESEWFIDFMLDVELEDDFEEFYEETGTEADDQGGPRINAQRFKIPNILEVLPDNLGVNRYLDMGCGGGWIMESLIPEIGPEYSAGLDISSTRLREAKRRNPDATFYRAPVEGVPLPDDSFDLITCLDVIEHIKEPHKLLEEANRLADHLVIKFPIEDTLFDRFQKEFWWPTKKRIKSWLTGEQPEERFEAHLHRFNFDAARKLLRQQGFTIKSENIILNPWTEGESFMYPPSYNIDESTSLTTKFDFQTKRWILKSLRMGTYVVAYPWYYNIFNSGIYFLAKRK